MKKPGGVTYIWCCCLFLFTGILCCIPFCVDSCLDAHLICVRCNNSKQVVPANCCWLSLQNIDVFTTACIWSYFIQSVSGQPIILLKENSRFANQWVKCILLLIIIWYFCNGWGAKSTRIRITEHVLPRTKLQRRFQQQGPNCLIPREYHVRIAEKRRLLNDQQRNPISEGRSTRQGYRLWISQSQWQHSVIS